MSSGAKVSVGVIVAIIVVGVALVYWQPQTSTPTTTPTTSTIDSVDQNRDAASVGAGASSGTSSTSPSTSTSTTPSTSITTPTTSPSSSATVPTATVTVTYTGTVFSPASVTIKSGQTVAFKNAASLPVNVDSDPYPADTDYVPLNIGIIESGQTSAAVTFTTAKTYGYHNHLNPTQTGSIIVQ